MAVPPDQNAEAGAGAACRPKSSEWLGVLLILAGFLVLNVLTCNLYPQVWCDEVWFSEPAVNMVREGAFHTRALMFQPPHTFPTINCPLYLMVQVPWLAVTGTSVLAIRSFNYSLMALAAFLVWMASWRLKLITSVFGRVVLVLLLHLGYGMSYAYRCSRPDILGMTCLLLLLLSFSIPNRRVREACLVILSAVSVWIGLQVAFFAGFACLMAVLVLRVVRIRELLLVSAGLALGAVSMALLLWWKGVMANFLPHMAAVMGRRYAHDSLPLGVKAHRVLSAVLSSSVEDFTTTALVAGLGLMLLWGWPALSRKTRTLNLYCLILVFGAPLLFDLVGHWAFYYAYLRFVPACLALFTTVGELTERGGGRATPTWPKVVWLATVALGMAVGLPMRLALAVTQCHLAARQELLRTLRSSIEPVDVVLSDHATFFEAKQIATEVYDPNYSAVLGHDWAAGGHDFSTAEKRAISVLIIRPEQAQQITNHLGGRWVPAGPPFGDTQDFGSLARLPVVGKRFVGYSLQPQNERYLLRIFKRAPDFSSAGVR
jgi:hypothetical protein